MIKRLSLSVFSVLRVLVARYVLLVLLEKPANKDRKSEFLNKPITENRPDIFMQKARSLIGTDLSLF